MAEEMLIKDVPSIPHTPRELERVPLILNQRPLGWLSDQIAGVAEGKTPKWWWAAFIPSFCVPGVRSFTGTVDLGRPYL